MVWAWQHEMESVDERGRPTRITALSLEPVEHGRRIRVAWYGTGQTTTVESNSVIANH